MRLYLCPIVLALTPVLLLAADAPQDAGGKDQERIQGTWAAVRLESEGKAAAAEAIKGTTFTVKGDQYTLKGDESYRGALKLDPAKKPKAIDATFVDEQGKEQGKAQGIYELEGDRLTICWSDKGGERPTEFAGKAGAGTRLMVFERRK